MNACQARNYLLCGRVPNNPESLYVVSSVRSPLRADSLLVGQNSCSQQHPHSYTSSISSQGSTPNVIYRRPVNYLLSPFLVAFVQKQGPRICHARRSRHVTHMLFVSALSPVVQMHISDTSCRLDLEVFSALDDRSLTKLIVCFRSSFLVSFSSISTSSTFSASDIRPPLHIVSARRYGPTDCEALECSEVRARANHQCGA